MKKGFVSRRLEEMRSRRGNFETRYGTNQNVLKGYRQNDGYVHLSTGHTIAMQMLEDIIQAFDGDVKYIAPEENADRVVAKYDILTKVRNQAMRKPAMDEERKGAILDAIVYGIGVMHRGYLDDGKNGSFAGIFTERVDPKYVYFDESAQKHYDPLGRLGINDLIRKRYYPKRSFKQIFSGRPYNQQAINKIVSKSSQEVMDEGERVIGDVMEPDVTSLNNDTPVESTAEGLVEVLEYWSEDKLVIESEGEFIYDGENPYEQIPFVIYTSVVENGTLYPSSVLETVRHLIESKDKLFNLWLTSTKFSAIPSIFASEDTGLIPGGELQPGLQLVESDNMLDIRQKIFEFRTSSNADVVIPLSQFIDDEIINTAKQDPKALRDRPQELATQTKAKQQAELKKIRATIDTMMKGAETQVAILDAKIVMKFVFADTKDVVVNDHRLNEEDELEEAEGSRAIVSITPEDWENFAYNVIVESKVENAIQNEEKRDDLLRLLEFGNVMLENPSIPPEEKQRFDFMALIEAVIDTFDDIPTEKIFTKKTDKQNLANNIKEMKKGKTAEPKVKDDDDRTNQMQAVLQAFGKEKDPMAKTRFAQYLTDLSEKPVEQTEGAAQAE